MTIATFVFAALAGGLGAALRYGMDTLSQRIWRSGFPLGILLINTSGSLLLGLLAGMAGFGGVHSGVVSEEVAIIFGAGLLGGYTTFSTTSVDSILLLRERRWLRATANLGGNLVLSVLATALGVFLGSLAV